MQAKNERIKFSGYGILVNGDCLEIMGDMKNNSVDCIITDPPYGISFVSGHRKEKYKKIYNDDNFLFIDRFLEQCKLKLKNNAHIYVFSGWQNIEVFKNKFDSFFETKNIIIWIKNNTGMGDLKSQYAPKYEMCMFGSKGKRELNGKRKPDIIHCSRTNNILHPTQKPVELIREFIRNSTNEGEIVFDCFSGSGTTAVASIYENRKFICIEKDREYFYKSAERIEMAIRHKQIYGDWI